MTKHVVKRGTLAARVIATARGEIGYREGGGATNNNNQKYSDQVPGFAWSDYQPWCDTFVAWCAWKNDIATAVWPRSASCDSSGAAFKNMHRWSEYPAIGAQVFFGTHSDLNHTGIVEAFDENYIWTIEGNTNDTGAREGDGVYRKKRLRRSTNVIGYGYPLYPEGIVSADPAWNKKPPEPKPEPTPEPNPEQLVFWCDLHPIYQKGFDFDKAWKQGIRAVAIKIGQGGDVEYGKDFTVMWEAAKRRGMKLSVYYWFESRVDIKKQVAHLLKLIPDNSVPVHFDIEPYTPKGGKADTPTKEAVLEATRLVKAAGLRPELGYLPNWVWKAHLPSLILPKPLTLWASRYGPNLPFLGPRKAYAANNVSGRWAKYAGQHPKHLQFGSRVRVGGKAVDCNAYRGDVADLDRWFLDTLDTPLPNPDPPPDVDPDLKWVVVNDGFWNIGAGKGRSVVECLAWLALHTEKFSVCEAGDRDEEVAIFLGEHPDWQGFWDETGGKKVRTFWKTSVYEKKAAVSVVATTQVKLTADGKKGNGVGPGTLSGAKRINHVTLVHRATGQIVNEVATHMIASWTGSLEKLGAEEYKLRRKHVSAHIARVARLLDEIPEGLVHFKADLNGPKSNKLLEPLRDRLTGWTGEPTHGDSEIDVHLYVDEPAVYKRLTTQHPDLTPGDHTAVVTKSLILERLS